MNQTARELGGFVEHSYKIQSFDDRVISLEREGLMRCKNSGDTPHIIMINKEISIDETRSRFSISYSIENKGEPCSFIFATETNLALLSRDLQAQSFVFPDESLLSPKPGTINNLISAKGYEYRDESSRLRIMSRFDPCGLWMIPVYTFSQSMGNMEKILQGTTVVHFWQLNLDKGAIFNTKLYWRAELAEEDNSAQKPLFDWL